MTTDWTTGTREVVAAAYAAAAAGDLKAITALLDPRVVIREAPSLPNRGDHHGREAALAALAPVFGLFDLANLEIEAIVVDGDWGIGLVRIPLRDGGVMPVAEVYRVKDGLIVEIRPYYWDTAALAGSGA